MKGGDAYDVMASQCEDSEASAGSEARNRIGTKSDF